ncbi:hypothetical protein IFM89_009831 [Coptis chinensis]|uniref:Fe2OG dioxygenase domain-containing protein n=1 Tax=Coptis chinensis TaxID=261450 RepID=A0A835HWX1_9MAGN|nr:hypothetical protein IFM89_009831 [Coptis chinensis]
MKRRSRMESMETKRVQPIATLTFTKTQDETIPEEFIRSENEQPGFTTFNVSPPEIPVIDLSQDQKDVVHLIAQASQEWGIFQIINHGVPIEVVDKLQSVGKIFFELPQEEKNLYAKSPGAKTIEGYGAQFSKEIEGKKTWVDHLFHNIWPPSRINYQFWPKNPPSYREAHENYAKYLKYVVDKQLIYLSLGLGLEEQVIREAVGGDELEYLLKINYYPPCPRPDLALGLIPHSDMSAITVLVPNEVQGLQVLKDDHWVDAKHIPNAFIIHIGDQIEASFFNFLWPYLMVLLTSLFNAHGLASWLEKLLYLNSGGKYLQIYINHAYIIKQGKTLGTTRYHQSIPNGYASYWCFYKSILSNGKYKSVLHRVVVNKDKTRMSWPVFCAPPEEMVVGPLPQLVNEANPSKYKTKKLKDYQYCKFNKIPQ